MTTESLEYGHFTSKSDVYSFGITLWELFSFGKVPMPQFNNSQVVERVLKGYRMDIPPGSPPEIASLMKQCWDIAPEQRPTFKHVLQVLQDVDVNIRRTNSSIFTPTKPQTGYYSSN